MMYETGFCKPAGSQGLQKQAPLVFEDARVQLSALPCQASQPGRARDAHRCFGPPAAAVPVGLLGGLRERCEGHRDGLRHGQDAGHEGVGAEHRREGAVVWKESCCAIVLF